MCLCADYSANGDSILNDFESSMVKSLQFYEGH